MNKLLHLTALLLCLSLHSLMAQRWSCAAQIGTTAYSGDVGEKVNWQPNLNRAAINASLAYSASDFLTLRLNLVAGDLSSSDAQNTTVDWRIKRAFSCNTPFVETALMTEGVSFVQNSGNHFTTNTH